MTEHTAKIYTFNPKRTDKMKMNNTEDLPDGWTAIFSRGKKWTRGHVEAAMVRMVEIRRDLAHTAEQGRYAKVVEGWIDAMPESEFKKQLLFTICNQGSIDATPLCDTVPEFDNPLDAIARRLNAEGFPRLPWGYFDGGYEDRIIGSPSGRTITPEDWADIPF
jgi:hypothetical protein